MMNNLIEAQLQINRRRMLWNMGGGLGGIALSMMMAEQGLLGRPAAAGPATQSIHPTAGLHFAPRAKYVIQLYMSGAASQCDMFDYKPRLIKDHGKPFVVPGNKEFRPFQSTPGAVMASPYKWSQHGQCGKWVSSVVPHLATCVDDIAFLPSMTATSNVHGPATFMQATGFTRPGFPSMGAWISYGLGSLNENLPAFVVLPDDRGFAPNGPKNWSSGFLPAMHQATMIRPGAREPIADLNPPAGKFITPEADSEAFQTLAKLGKLHQEGREGDSRLDARIRSYELAARLQLSAPEVLEISRETPGTLEAYGVGHANPEINNFGRRCLIARRLIERGVRFVQIWSGADNTFPRVNWDTHEDIEKDLTRIAEGMDQPTAALIKDLKRRGMLDETLIIWTTEFGRLPCAQGGKGRDHNPFAFTSWMAGGGIKGGTTYGATDDYSFAAEEHPIMCYDQHATALRLLGIDHEKLTYRNDGIDRRLTDVHGHVIQDIIA